MEVAILVISAGQNVIGRVCSRGDNQEIELSHLRSLVPVPQPNGGVAISMFPVLAFSTTPDAPIMFSGNDYMVEMPNPMPNIVKGFLEQTSGIQLG